MTIPTPDEICERLRVRARRVSETMRVMAQAKSLRQAHNPPRDDLYMWPKPEETVEWQAADLIQQQRAEIAEARNERDALLERPITLAKMDSLDEDATDRMIAYYWCEQATEARKARDDLQATIERLNEHCVEAEMRAHQWMKAHDKLKAGKPYDLPSPADLPNALSTIERLSAALEEIESYKWPVFVGEYTETFFGEATGAEYKLKHPITKETSLRAFNNVKAIARAALGKDAS